MNAKCKMQNAKLIGLSILHFAFCILHFSASAQTNNTDRLIARALESPSAWETLSYLTDEIGPRLSGSKNAALAVKYATERFRSWGIDVADEKVMVPHWVRGEERATLVSHNDQKIVLTALGGSVATPAKGIVADVVEVNSYDELKQLGAKVKGKIVYYNNPMDMEMVRSGRAFEAYRDAVQFRSSGASRAAELGAVASVIRSVASASLRTPHTGAVRYDAKLPKIPAAALTVEDALLVHRLIARGDRVRMHIVLTPQTLPDAESANVVAEIRGSERPEEVVVIGGHLDSWDLGTGAIDDGSGAAMVMESLHLMKELGIRPRRTIRCVLFMNEENGLNGGRAYAAAHKNEKHVAAIESDAGAAAPTGFSTTLKGDALSAFESRVGFLSQLKAKRFETAQETGADTSFLIEAGVPGFSLVPEPLHYFDFHHTPADTLDKIDPKELNADVAAVASLALELADGPELSRPAK
jgi:carboxypeptidase Q